ncbi:M1 family metallopeptidase [Actinomadura parmotrematis]|uniref:M1 family metallopeptidase n=1 Tax=Actinomadura parmotrematis TaxID=2864039 RepID=UPI0027E22201|nr:M1 family metallopeptidase [Actinomadura parmotrematis]
MTAAATAAALVVAAGGAAAAAPPGRRAAPAPAGKARAAAPDAEIAASCAPVAPPAGGPAHRRRAVPPPEGALPPASPPPAPAEPVTPPGASTALDDCEGPSLPRPRIVPPAPPAAALVPAPAGPKAAGPAREKIGGPGAAGLGDAYFKDAGNGGYDVSHYDVALTYDAGSRGVAATVTITAKATEDLSAFNLDFRGPKIVKTLVGGRPAARSRKGQELTLTPAAPLRAGRAFTAVVQYAGRPGPVRAGSLGTYGWVPTKDGAIVVAEPDGAPTWLPVNDHPRDKATYAFHVKVPNGLRALANGKPAGSVRKGGATTYHWRETSPMASYLAMVAIGKFQVRTGRAGKIPVITAVDPKYAADAKRLQSTTVAALKWEQKVFGRYPFATSGGIVDDPRLDYALESQERPVYAGFAPDEEFVVHELAHQWFGDSVSLSRWQDIWLNEGFATYAEWLWQERGHADTAKGIYDRYYRQPADSPIFSPPPGRPGRSSLFGFSVYIRGAMALQALRQRVGDKAFFTILKRWAATRAGGSATTPEFAALAEKVSGKKLDRLFQVWLYQSGKPRKW